MTADFQPSLIVQYFSSSVHSQWMNWIYKKLFPVWNVHRNDTKNFHYLVNCYGFFNSLICETIRFYLITANVRIITRLRSLVCDVMCVGPRDSVTKLWQSPERRDVCPTEVASQTKLSSAHCAAHSTPGPGQCWPIGAGGAGRVTPGSSRHKGYQFIQSQ